MNSQLSVPAVGLALALLSQTAFGADHFDIKVIRDHSDKNCISGRVAVNGQVVCYSLELPWKGNAPNVSAIPVGKYSGFLRYDKKDGWRIQLKAVPGRSAIQIHMGNYTKDSKGCILVGTSLSGNCTLRGSAKAYAKLKKLFYGSDTPNATPNKKITLTVVDASFPIQGKWENRKAQDPAKKYWAVRTFQFTRTKAGVQGNLTVSFWEARNGPPKQSTRTVKLTKIELSGKVLRFSRKGIKNPVSLSFKAQIASDGKSFSVTEVKASDGKPVGKFTYHKK